MGVEVLYTSWMKFRASTKLQKSRKGNTRTPFWQALLTTRNYIFLTPIMLVKRAYVTVKMTQRCFLLHFARISRTYSLKIFFCQFWAFGGFKPYEYINFVSKPYAKYFSVKTVFVPPKQFNFSELWCRRLFWRIAVEVIIRKVFVILSWFSKEVCMIWKKFETFVK